MAVKAAEQITITDMTDVKSFCRYYLLQSSTLAAPSKPTTNSPSSSWTKTEPSYTAGSTNSLYFTDLTVFSNDTFSYSDVSLSSSYEAAKTAYNKAVEAAKTATNFISYDSTNGLQVGNQQSGSWKGARTQMTFDSFNILDAAGSVLAKYGTALIELGRNARNAVIKLCSGAGEISVKNVEEYGGDTLSLYSRRIKLEASHAAGMSARHFATQSYHDNMTGEDTEIYSYDVEAWNNIICYDEPAGAGTGAANVRIGARYHRSEGGEVVADGESAISINESNINIRASQAIMIETPSVMVNGRNLSWRCGEKAVGTISSGGDATVSVEFEEEMATPPLVFLQYGGSYPHYIQGVSFKNVTTKGFDIYVKLNSSRTLSPTIRWFAIAP